ncbi:CRISPR-associated endonuclease Cas1 [Streptomyces smyrnaeus]|uniref:CRISPR-associated endonuclease Cas1 n=1 Tax=Streptomyces smyrnaeus TaxID=1387713 RepID=UPI00339F14E0
MTVAHNGTAALRLDIARYIAAGKIRNSRWVLLRTARDAEPSRRSRIRVTADELAASLQAIADTDSLDALLGVEGNSARTYFASFADLLRPTTGITAFTHRNCWPPTDPANALLSFTYGLLRGLVHGAAEQIGLDPYIGFLHGLRPAKPALALALMEEFRPILAGGFALTLLNRRQLKSADFETLPGGAVRLTEDGRRIVLDAWQKMKLQPWEHRIAGRDVQAGLLPVVQARLLARHLRKDLPAYLPWTAA